MRILVWGENGSGKTSFCCNLANIPYYESSQVRLLKIDDFYVPRISEDALFRNAQREHSLYVWDIPNIKMTDVLLNSYLVRADIVIYLYKSFPRNIPTISHKNIKVIRTHIDVGISSGQAEEIPKEFSCCTRSVVEVENIMTEILYG